MERPPLIQAFQTGILGRQNRRRIPGAETRHPFGELAIEVSTIDDHKETGTLTNRPSLVLSTPVAHVVNGCQNGQ